MKKLILLILFPALLVSAQNIAMKWHPLTVEGSPTNCIAQYQDIGLSTLLPEGFNFITNGPSARFFLLFSETNFNNFTSNRVFLSTSNRNFWTVRRDACLSNILFYSTNITAGTAALASSNTFMLRAAEERLNR